MRGRDLCGSEWPEVLGYLWSGEDMKGCAQSGVAGLARIRTVGLLSELLGVGRHGLAGDARKSTVGRGGEEQGQVQPGLAGLARQVSAQCGKEQNGRARPERLREERWGDAQL